MKKNINPELKHVGKTIKLLKELYTDDNCKRMNRSNVLGYMGELYVYSKLKKEIGFNNFIQKGNQSRYDFEIPKSKIKIDVKTSAIKQEDKTLTDHWGWALKFSNREKELVCTHFVCVALNKKYNPEWYFVIKVKNLSKFEPTPFGQFSKVCNSFGYIQNEIIKPTFNEKLIKFYTYNHKLVKNGTVIQVPANGSLVDALI